jgi:hypothetical protein
VLALEPRECDMRSVGSRIAMPPPAEIIKVKHAGWIAGETFVRRHLLKWELRPQPAFIAEGAEPAFRR